MYKFIVFMRARGVCRKTCILRHKIKETLSIILYNYNYAIISPVLILYIGSSVAPPLPLSLICFVIYVGSIPSSMRLSLYSIHIDT